MLIVGLQCGHDASVAVVLDGQVLLHLERERESRERHVHWISADIIHDALAYCGLSAADVDFFALCTTQRSGYGTDTPERLRFGYAWETAEKIGVNAFRRTIFDHAASVAATDPYQDGPDLKRVYNTEAPERADAWITPRGMGVIDDIDGDAVRRIFTSPELASTSVVPMSLCPRLARVGAGPRERARVPI